MTAVGIDRIALRVIGHGTAYDGYYGLEDYVTGYYDGTAYGTQTWVPQAGYNRYVKVCNLDGTDVTGTSVYLYNRQYSSTRTWMFGNSLGATDGVVFGFGNSIGSSTAPVGWGDGTNVSQYGGSTATLDLAVFAASVQDVKPDISLHIPSHASNSYLDAVAGYWGIVNASNGTYTHTTDRGVYYIQTNFVQQYGSSFGQGRYACQGASYWKKVANIDCSPAWQSDEYIYRKARTGGYPYTTNFLYDDWRVPHWQHATSDVRNYPSTKLLGASDQHMGTVINGVYINGGNSLEAFTASIAGSTSALSTVCGNLDY